MANEEKLSKALQDFKMKYPSITSVDLQTFIIGWQEAVKNCSMHAVINRRELLIAYSNFNLMTPKVYSCSEESIDDFLTTNNL